MAVTCTNLVRAEIAPFLYKSRITQEGANKVKQLIFKPNASFSVLHFSCPTLTGEAVYLTSSSFLASATSFQYKFNTPKSSFREHLCLPFHNWWTHFHLSPYRSGVQFWCLFHKIPSPLHLEMLSVTIFMTCSSFPRTRTPTHPTQQLKSSSVSLLKLCRLPDGNHLILRNQQNTDLAFLMLVQLYCSGVF